MATPSEQSPCSSQASKNTEKICPRVAGEVKGKLNNLFLLGFSRLHIEVLLNFLICSLDRWSFFFACCRSVADGVSLEGRDMLSYRKTKIFNVGPASKSITLLLNQPGRSRIFL